MNVSLLSRLCVLPSISWVSELLVVWSAWRGRWRHVMVSASFFLVCTCWWLWFQVVQGFLANTKWCSQVWKRMECLGFAGRIVEKASLEMSLLPSPLLRITGVEKGMWYESSCQCFDSHIILFLFYVMLYLKLPYDYKTKIWKHLIDSYIHMESLNMDRNQISGRASFFVYVILIFVFF